ncbi:MAG: hypothetical protein H6573_31905 [Lewinellaceae bacterium]|nr:hypothetical protein [Lewinellaceae bacterium]
MTTPIAITVTDNLSRQQQLDAGRLSALLNASFRPGPRVKEVNIHFRPATVRVSDQLIYFPQHRRLIVYWGVSSETSLESALLALAAELPLLQLPDNPLSEALTGLAENGRPVNKGDVQAYWSSPYQGGPHWFVRLQLLPEWYSQWQAAPLAVFLNQHAPLVEGHPGLQTILLTYQAFRRDAHPDNGLFHYQPEEGRLIINVPLPLGDLPRLVQPPSTQRYTLSAMLLSFLYLQRDPGIPELAFTEWREGLERAFREEGFWEGVGER